MSFDVDCSEFSDEEIAEIASRIRHLEKEAALGPQIAQEERDRLMSVGVDAAIDWLQCSACRDALRYISMSKPAHLPLGIIGREIFKELSHATEDGSRVGREEEKEARMLSKSVIVQQAFVDFVKKTYERLQPLLGNSV